MTWQHRNRIDITSPLRWVQTESLQSTFLTQGFSHINKSATKKTQHLYLKKKKTTQNKNPNSDDSRRQSLNFLKTCVFPLKLSRE